MLPKIVTETRYPLDTGERDNIWQALECQSFAYRPLPLFTRKVNTELYLHF